MMIEKYSAGTNHNLFSIHNKVIFKHVETMTNIIHIYPSKKVDNW